MDKKVIKGIGVVAIIVLFLGLVVSCSSEDVKDTEVTTPKVEQKTGKDDLTDKYYETFKTCMNEYGFETRRIDTNKGSIFAMCMDKETIGDALAYDQNGWEELVETLRKASAQFPSYISLAIYCPDTDKYYACAIQGEVVCDALDQIK